MRRLLLSLALLLTLGAGCASAAVATTGVVAHGGNNSNMATVVTGAMSSTTTAGNIISLFVTWDNGSAATISTVAGGGASVTWTNKIAKKTDTRHGQNIAGYIGVVNTGGTTAITVTFNTNCFAKTALAAEVSGQNATQYDATATSITAAGTAVTIAITATQANCLIMGMAADDLGANTITVPTGMTSLTTDSGAGNNSALHYRTVNPGSGATSVDWTFSGTDDAVVAAVSIAPPAASGGCTDSHMLGVWRCDEER